MVGDVYAHILDEDRKQNAVLFEEAFYKLSDSITGKNVSKAMEDDAKKTRDALASVLKYYGVKKIKEVNEIIIHLGRYSYSI